MLQTLDIEMWCLAFIRLSSNPFVEGVACTQYFITTLTQLLTMIYFNSRIEHLYIDTFVLVPLIQTTTHTPLDSHESDNDTFDASAVIIPLSQSSSSTTAAGGRGVIPHWPVNSAS